MQLPWRSLPRPPARAPHSVWPPSATTLLLASLTAGAVAQWGSSLDDTANDWVAQGGLSAGGLKAGHAWQLLTHLFVNTGPGWLLPVSLVTLALAGRPLEGIVGRRHLWQLFALAGVAGGLGQVGFDVLLRQEAVVGGPSSAAMGVLLALAYVSPKTPLLPWARPVALRQVKVVHGTLGALAATVVAGTHPPAAGAMVGGLAGCLYMHALGFGRWNTEEDAPTVSGASSASWGQSPGKPKASTVAVATKNASAAPPPAAPERPMNAREFIAARVDPVLEKISREGLGSLTPEERRILEQAREKVSRGR